MQLEIYPIEINPNHIIYEFVSEGPHGKINKRVEFTTLSNDSDVYNIGFGDWSVNGDLDDLSVTDNSDTGKVLATVAICVVYFLKFYPHATVFATGNTLSRNRLYRMAISKYLSQLEFQFEIFGYKNDDWETFGKGIDYKAFLLKRKNH